MMTSKSMLLVGPSCQRKTPSRSARGRAASSRAAAPASPRGPCRAGRTPTSCYPSAFPSLSLALFPSRSASPPPKPSSSAGIQLQLRGCGRGGRAGSTTTPTSSSPSRCSRTATRRCRRRLPSGGRPAARLASASASRSRFVILSRSSLHLLMALKFVATPSFKILVLKQLALALADDLWSIFGQFIAPNS